MILETGTNKKLSYSYKGFFINHELKKSKIMECRLRNFYKKWITIGRIPEHGLCNSMPTIELGDILFLFKPEKDQIDHGYPRAYWGCEFPFKDIEDVYMMHGFTPLRQIIVLLMCEMIEDDTYIFPPLRSR